MTTTYKKTRKDSNNRTTISFFYAAPIVDKNWNIEKPVTLFAIAESKSEIKLWDKPYRAGIKTSKIYAEEYNVAIAKCIKSNSLKYDKNYIIIKWVKSPEIGIENVFNDFKDTLLIWNLILILGILIFRFVLFFKRKNKEQEKPKINSGNGNNISKLSSNAIIRIIFSFYLFYISIFSIYYSKFSLSDLRVIAVLSVSLVFYIIAVSTLNLAHKKANRHLKELFFLFIYPFTVYALIFYKLEYNIETALLFCGFFYFFIITGGFIFGILLSPLFAKFEKKTIKDKFDIRINGEKEKIKTGKSKYAIFTFLSSLFIALTFVFIKLLNTINDLNFYGIAAYYFFLFIGIGFIIKFTYQHTVYSK
jgi:hypothetical protein